MRELGIPGDQNLEQFVRVNAFKVRQRVAAGKHSVRQVADEIGVDRWTLSRSLRRLAASEATEPA